MTNAQKKAPYNALVWFLYLKLCVCIGPCSVFGMLFETRSKEATIPTVRKGTLIKVGCCGERFWCIVSDIKRNGRVLALVDNDLVWLPWQWGDPLHLELENVLETSENIDGAHLSNLIGRFESISDAAMYWHSERIADGRAVSMKPHTVLILPTFVKKKCDCH